MGRDAGYVSQGVQDEGVQPLPAAIHALLGDAHHVRAIGQVAEPEAQDAGTGRDRAGSAYDRLAEDLERLDSGRSGSNVQAEARPRRARASAGRNARRRRRRRRCRIASSVSRLADTSGTGPPMALGNRRASSRPNRWSAWCVGVEDRVDLASILLPDELDPHLGAWCRPANSRRGTGTARWGGSSGSGGRPNGRPRSRSPARGRPSKCQLPSTISLRGPIPARSAGPIVRHP